MKKKSVVGWITKDGGDFGWTEGKTLYMTGSGIWKNKMGKTDIKIRLTIEPIIRRTLTRP